MLEPPIVAIGYIDQETDQELLELLRSLLAELLGTERHSPLRNLIPHAEGRTVVIKPNMVRHFNPTADLNAVITSPLTIKALVILARELVGHSGRVIIADSPQNDCDFSALLATPGWRSFCEWARESAANVEMLDMRPEQVQMIDGVIAARRQLPGDPLGEVVLDIGPASAFVGSGLDHERLRGSDYDPQVTRSSHAGGRHEYSICRTFLDADLLIVVPKIKTHKKVGLSLAMKNLVGLVGEKNRLPHHTAGFSSNGGDEYPRKTAQALIRQWAIERARPLLAGGRFTQCFRALRRMEHAALPEVIERSGNWWGNDTAWRMVLDLVTLLRRERLERARPTLFIYDGLIVGEGEGPLAPDPLRWNLLAAATDPVAGDLLIARELGFDTEQFALLAQAVRRQIWSTTSGDAKVVRVGDARSGPRPRLHPGWATAPPNAGARNG